MEEENNKKYSGMPVASLVLGIISILTGLFYYLSLPTGITAIVLGVKSAKKLGSKMGKAGLILGIIGVSWTAFLYISFFLILILANIY